MTACVECPFAIVSTQRSGSAYLGSVLSAHPDVTVAPEVFLGQGMRTPENFYAYWAGWVQSDPKHLAPPQCMTVVRTYLDGLFASAEDERAKGFALKYDQIPLVPGLMEILQERGVRMVHLIRLNVLESIVSSVRNHLRVSGGGRAHGTGPMDPPQVHIEADRLAAGIARRVAEIEQNRKALRSRFASHEVHLEACAKDREDPGGCNAQVLRGLEEFLGVAPQTDLRTTLRSSGRGLGEMISNFDEVREVLSGTDWEHMTQPAGALPRPALREDMPLDSWHALCSCLCRVERMLEGGRAREAEHLLAGLRQSMPDEGAVAAALATVVLERGDIGRSVSLYRIALHLNPQDAYSAARLQALQPGAAQESAS